MALDMSGLFVNPALVREKRLEGIAQQQQALAGLGGSMSGLLGQVAGGGNIMGQVLAEGIARQAGLKTKEEAQAEASQAIFKNLDQTNPESYFDAAMKMQQQGLTKSAYMLTEKGRELQATQAATERQARLDEQERQNNIVEQALKAAEVGIKGQELGLKQEKHAADMSQLGMVLGMDLKDATVESKAAATAILAKGPLEGETDAEMKSRAAKVLQTIDRRSVTTITQKGEGAFRKQLGEEDAKAFSESETQVGVAKTSIMNIREGERLLNSGIYTGMGAQFKLDYARAKDFFNMADASEKELIQRTEKYQVAMGKEVLSILGTGDLGSGTGLSDKDREFAEKVANKEIALDEGTLRDLLDISKRARVYKIRKHNEKVAKMNQRYDTSLQPVAYHGLTATNPTTNAVMVYMETPDQTGWATEQSYFDYEQKFADFQD